MFVRAELKQQAKDLMKGRFAQMFLVCFLGGLLCGNSNVIELSFNVEASQAEITLFNSFDFSIAVAAIGLIALISIILSIVLWAFVSAPAEQGMKYYFRNVTLGQERFEDLLYSFSNNYLENVKVLFARDIRIMLWSLLLIIPGIIKGYEYAFVDYLLNDHPGITSDEVLEISSAMTNGLKWEMFVLDLSFILWNLLASGLAVFTLGLSITAVDVYRNQTHAQLYDWALKNREITL